MIKLLYKNLLKPFLFLFDAERVHDWFVNIGEFAGKFVFLRWMVQLIYGKPESNTTIAGDGVKYNRPVILAAGFDYNARLLEILYYVGFGGEEIGSVTALPCPGNKSPRLKRMIKSRSLIVNKGLKNEGVEAVIKRIKKAKIPKNYVYGISIAKTNSDCTVDLEDGINDYFQTFKRVNEENVGSFITINISCPNVFGGENFAHPERLNLLLEKLRTITSGKPMYLKLPINVSKEEIFEMIDVGLKYDIQGVIIGNLNKDYKDTANLVASEMPEKYEGGLSGAACKKLSTDLIRAVKNKYHKKITIIGCGGILSVEDAKEKFEAGADLIQLISGMIFEGPHLMNQINDWYFSEWIGRKDQ